MSEFSILRQSGTQQIETRIALQYAMVTDTPIRDVHFTDLAMHAKALSEGATLPIGSVEFVREAITLAGLIEPENISYPEVLRPYLHRHIEQRPVASLRGHYFVKPTTTKAFTGFVLDNEHPGSSSNHAQWAALQALPPQTPVWISEPVSFQSEFRYYILDGKVLGEGRYDDGPDEAPVPEAGVVAEMAGLMTTEKGAPIAFSLDVGVLATGETALIECNDAWALGYYKGTLSQSGYIKLLWQRWQQLTQTNRTR